jgi:hypothetical protein
MEESFWKCWTTLKRRMSLLKYVNDIYNLFAHTVLECNTECLVK